MYGQQNIKLNHTIVIKLSYTCLTLGVLTDYIFDRRKYKQMRFRFCFVVGDSTLVKSFLNKLISSADVALFQFMSFGAVRQNASLIHSEWPFILLLILWVENVI
jgi:hypothetical protein